MGPKRKPATLILNIAANYSAKLWGIASVYLFIPIYIKLLGVPAYGLIAFYAVALAVLFVTESGISATFGREAAREKDVRRLVDLLASMEFVLFAILGAVGTAFFLSAELIATRWLNTGNTVGTGVAVDSIRWMSIALVPQIAMALYVGGLMGLQKQVTANLLTVSFGVARSALVILPIFLFRDVRVFFAWQAIVSWLFVLVMRGNLRLALSAAFWKSGVWSFKLLRPLLGYACGMFAMALIAGINNQIDRLVVSKLLSLEDFSFYSLTAMLAQIPVILTTPIAMAVSPKLTGFAHDGNKAKLLETYEGFSVAIAAIGSAAAFGLFFFGDQIIAIWLHGQQTPQYMVPVLKTLAIGSLFLTLQLAPYYVSMAHGHTRTNVQLGLAALIFTVPAQIYLTHHYGVTGSSITWIVINIFAFFYLGVRLNYRFNSDGVARWFLRCTVPPVAVSFGLFYIGHKFVTITHISGFSALGVAAIVGFASLGANFKLWRTP